MRVILNKTFIKNFYRQQAGFFLFIFLIFFGLIAPSMQLAYHYALIRGMLAVPAFMALVALAWLGYAGKVDRYVETILGSAEYQWLGRLQALPRGLVFIHFLRIQAFLMAPVWGYAGIVAVIGWRQKAAEAAWFVVLYNAILILAGARRYLWRLEHPGEEAVLNPISGRIVSYWSILMRYLLAENKALILGIKLFSCGMLYLMLRIQTPADYDLRMPYFAFSLALFGHGLLLYRCRAMETSRMLWYRALPVPLIRRFGQIALFCGLLLLPEMTMLGWLSPDPIRVTDALSFIISAFSLLLLLYSLLLAMSLTTGDYLKLCLVLFGILYAGVLGGFLIVVSGLFILTAMVLFVRGY